MIDVSSKHIESLIEGSWHPDTLEYYEQEEEFYRLDFSNEKDVSYAIKKWLSMKWFSIQSKIQYKEDLRYCITAKKWVLGNVFMNNLNGNTSILTNPNIKSEYWNDWDNWDNEEKNYFNFLLILWNEWFNEPFVSAELSNYRERTDREFVEFPHMPELWKEARYIESQWR